MAETEQSNPIVLDLKNMGKQVAIYIDLYDEGQFGADKLALRGRFDNLADVGSMIKEVLSIGSPIENPASEDNILAFNRFNSFAAHWSRYSETDEPYAKRAGHMLYFRLVIHLLDSTAHIGFGVKWAKYRKENGKINKQFPCGNFTPDKNMTMDDLRLIDTWGISWQDAHDILLAIGVTNPIDLDIDLSTGKASKEQLDWFEKYVVPADEVMASYTNPETGEEEILFHGESVLTVDKQ